MRKILIGVLMMVALPAMAAEPKEVIEAAIKAHGGKAAITKYPAEEYDFEGEMSVMGQNLTLKGSAIQADGGRFRMEMNAEAGGQKINIIQIANGKKVSFKMSLGGQELPAPDGAIDDLKMASTLSEILRIYPLLDDKRFTLKAGDDAEVEGKKASVIVVTVKDHAKDITLYFDKASGRLVKEKRKLAGPDGKEADQESIYSDFKEIEGVQVPMKQTVYMDGVKFMTMTLSNYKFLDKVADTTKFNVDN
jgi:hypothetical protein